MKKLFGIFFACLLIVNVFALYSAANAQETYNYVTQWGGKGSSNGQFDVPSGVAVDSSGNVFVADSNNSRIQKFDNNGNFLRSDYTFYFANAFKGLRISIFPFMFFSMRR